MTKPLPVGDFEWMNDEELEDWKSHPCILEVDLEYPEELHDLHNEYPLAPEKLKMGKVEKLIPNLRDKEKYVIHHENLKLYEKLGLKLKKIHKGIKFKEENFMEKYIDFNNEKRTKAKNEFEKNFYKLLNNAVFGKTMENVRNRVDIQLVNTEKKVKKLINKSQFDKSTIFSKYLISMHMHRKNVKLNKPIYLGFSILEHSKIIMYNFHYKFTKGVIKKIKSNLLYTDTDSLLYEFYKEDIHKIIALYVKDYFDTSNFPPNHPSGIPCGKNKKKGGYMKDECGGKIMVEFASPRAKVYAINILDGEFIKKM